MTNNKLIYKINKLFSLFNHLIIETLSDKNIYKNTSDENCI